MISSHLRCLSRRSQVDRWHVIAQCSCVRQSVAFGQERKLHNWMILRTSTFLLYQCPEVPSLGDVCSSDDMQQKAIAACQILVDSSDVFGSCLQVVRKFFCLIRETSHRSVLSLSLPKVNGRQYYNACITDYCMTATYRPTELQQAMCNSYSALARDCTDNYLDVTWRTASRCRMFGELSPSSRTLSCRSSEIMSKQYDLR